jgi:hypothetical protein
VSSSLLPALILVAPCRDNDDGGKEFDEDKDADWDSDGSPAVSPSGM